MATVMYVRSMMRSSYGSLHAGATEQGEEEQEGSKARQGGEEGVRRFDEGGDVRTIMAWMVACKNRMHP